MKTVIEDVLALAVPPFMGAMMSEMRTLVREMTPHDGRCGVHLLPEATIR